MTFPPALPGGGAPRRLASLLIGILVVVPAASLLADIGVSFRSNRGDPPVTGTSGVEPRGNWNNSDTSPVGSTSGIASPQAGTLVDHTGAATGVTITWTSTNTWNTGDGADPMMNGYLDNTTPETPTTVTFSNIPYADYDVIVYVGSDGNGRTGRTRINGQSWTDIYYVTNSNPFTGHVEATSKTQPGAQPATYVRYRNVTGSTLTVENVRVTNNCGLHGIQIISNALPGAPQVENRPADSVTASSAVLRGEVVDIGSSAPSVTIYYGAEDGGTNSAGWASSVVLPGTQAGPFSAMVGALQPNTVYFYRSRATNPSGSVWAPDVQSLRTVALPPTVANLPASNILARSATLGASVASTGGEAPQVTIYYGTFDGGTDRNAWASSLALGVVPDSAAASVSGLQSGITYRFRAFAENSGGSAWAAASGTFQTPVVAPPMVSMSGASNVTGISAVLEGGVTSTGGDPPDVILYLGRSDGGTEPAQWEAAIPLGVQSGAFQKLVAALAADATYFARARAENGGGFAWSPETVSFQTAAATVPQIVINEIHYDHDDAKKKTEFIELYNAGAEEVNLTGWTIGKGVGFVFPEGTVVAPDGYVVVAMSPAALQAEYGFAGALAWSDGRLSNDGEEITLVDAGGNVIDRVDYGLGFPWPTVGDPPSPSIELIHPALDNDLGGSWRASGAAVTSGSGGGGFPASYVSAAAPGWRYRKGTSEPAGGTGAWRAADYVEDGTWATGQTPVGFGDGDDNTELTDMQGGGGYTSVYLRRTFTVDGPVPPSLNVRLYYDDGAVVWINGIEVARRNVSQANPPFDASASGNHEATEYEGISVPGAAGILRQGVNVIAVQGFNASLSSSDFSIDVELLPDSGGAGLAPPSPGRRNTSFSESAPPQVRQVEHSPGQPGAGQAVAVTAKVTDPDGVGEVTLAYQIVEPGDYVAISDPRFETDWTMLPMRDDGNGGDATAGDDVFTAVLPAAVQVHRRLVRYRVTAADGTGVSVRVPYADDPQPNFAYFVYDGVPNWAGSARPGVQPVVDYDFSQLEPVPVYHLVTTRKAHEDAQYIPDSTRGGGYTGSEYLWEGTLVYDGRVYDHIRYRPRGGVWRFSMGKNMWKFDFNRGHSFQARDDYGRKYETRWDKLNFSALIQQGNFGQRGEQGLFEWAGFRLHNLAGNPAPKTHFVHFRIVEQADESGSPSSQFDDDFQGLYLAVEQLDGRFLDEHDLPDGNLYKMEGGTGELNNQGPDQPADKSDLNQWLSTYQSAGHSPEWWDERLDLPGYYSFRAIATAIHDYDIGFGKNYFFFNNPELNKWQVVNWDLDLTWTTTYNGDNNRGPLSAYVLAVPELNLEYQNRMRELVDLLFNPDQTGRLLDECARVVYTPGQPSFVDADRAMWDYNPIMVSRYINSDKAGYGRYYEATGARTFAAMLQHVKNYVGSRVNWIEANILRNDSQLPARPSIAYAGVNGFPTNGLRFRSSTFQDPQGNATFGAMQWRIGEVYHNGLPGYVDGDPFRYEIDATWESGAIDSFTQETAVPAIAVREGRTYRARVRHRDADGNWSSWSEPLEFTAGTPDIQVFTDNVAVTEVMYHPSPPTLAELAINPFFSEGDFEWIEVANLGDATIDLGELRFTKGIDFDFAGSPAAVLEPGQRAVVVKNMEAFQARYGHLVPAPLVAGEWEASDSLANGGEEIKLSFAAGTTVVAFTYGDAAPWPDGPDGSGFSLDLIAPGGGTDPTLPWSWQTSPVLGGTPGFASGRAFTGDPDADVDGDGINALLEHFFGTSDEVPDAGMPIAGGVDTFEVGGIVGSYPVMAVQRSRNAADVRAEVEFSRDLLNWEGGDSVFVYLGESVNPDGTSTLLYRGTGTADFYRNGFFRARVSR